MQRSIAHPRYGMHTPDAPSPLERATLINAEALAERWWSIALRGVAAVIFGALTLFWPGVSLYALVILFGAYAIVDGAFNLVMAGKGARRGRPWGSLVVAGITSVAAGVLTLIWPNITALILVLLIAAWAVVIGVFEIVAAVRLRKQIRGEWLLGLSGALSIALGVLLLFAPAAGALTLVLWIGAYAIVVGGLLIALSVKLLGWRRGHEPLPPGGFASAH